MRFLGFHPSKDLIELAQFVPVQFEEEFRQLCLAWFNEDDDYDERLFRYRKHDIYGAKNYAQERYIRAIREHDGSDASIICIYRALNIMEEI